MNQPIKGTGVAIVTPFKDGQIDFDALEKIIEHLINGGIDFIVSLGTTGEAITMSREECRSIFDFTIKKINRRVPLVAGFFGSNNTASLVKSIQNYNLNGFDAIMSSSPAYNKPTQEGIYQHFMALEKVSPLPIIIYNVPGRTASNIEAETTLRLAHASDKFIAVKEASGNVVQAMQIIKNRPNNFLVLSGDDPITLPIIACGGNGVISVIANAFPREFSDMVRAALNGDFQKANKLNERLLDVHPWLYVDGNPAGIKAAMEMLDLCRKEVRLPLVDATKKTMQGLWEEVKTIIKSPQLV